MSAAGGPRRSYPAEESELLETVRLLLALAAAVILLLGCTVGPLMVLIRFGPGFGLLASTVAFPVWIYLGPPPMPGLVNGVVCLWGLAAIAVAFLFCLARLIMAFLF